MATEQEINDARQVAAMLEDPRWDFKPLDPGARFLGRKGNYDLWYAGDAPVHGGMDARVPTFLARGRLGAIQAWSRSARDALKCLASDGSTTRVVLRHRLSAKNAPFAAALEEARARFFAPK